MSRSEGRAMERTGSTFSFLCSSDCGWSRSLRMYRCSVNPVELDVALFDPDVPEIGYK